MRNNGCTQSPKAGLRPKDYLTKAECLAIEIRRRLRSLNGLGGFPRTSAAKDDAEALVNQIEKLSIMGRKCSAEEAIEIVEIVEVLSLQLSDDIDALLASGNQQVG